jgi:hypothetical protein
MGHEFGCFPAGSDFAETGQALHPAEATASPSLAAPSHFWRRIRSPLQSHGARILPYGFDGELEDGM